MKSNTNTIKFAAIKDFAIHLYFDVRHGYVLETRVLTKYSKQFISKDDANKLEKQLFE